jgi:hypothetical protein
VGLNAFPGLFNDNKYIPNTLSRFFCVGYVHYGRSFEPFGCPFGCPKY